MAKVLRKEVQDYLDVFNNVTLPAMLAAGWKQTIVNAREGLAVLTKNYTPAGPAVVQILDDVIPCKGYQVPVRIFNPDPSKALPVLIYYHGGGHGAGSVPVYDPIYRNLAVRTKHIVIAPEYRLAPENPYPAGEIDAYNTLVNFRPLLDSLKIKYIDRVSIAGDSAGGALCAVLNRRLQSEPEIKVHRSVLIYPCVDYSMAGESLKELATGYLLTTAKVAWYHGVYLAHNENRRVVSPLYGEFTKNMPKSLVITAQFCVLRSEGKAYADKMKEAGAEVEYINMDNMTHTFLNTESLNKEECDFVYGKIHEFLNN
ncbi:MAG: alpha/beta hydrolase [Fusobacteriaceae bacterium]|jgi:acetyl esterase/lipase|nr:alpha/beta hydrolase [Fusobacteriaceae bacterium]